MAKNRTQPFEIKVKGHVVEVWLGPANHPEGEFVLSVDQTLIPALIAVLKSHMHK